MFALVGAITYATLFYWLRARLSARSILVVVGRSEV